MPGADDDGALRSLLSRHPGALVAGISDDGLFTPLPPSVPVDGHPRALARSALDLVRPADRGLVIKAWDRVRAEGEAHAVVRMAGAAGGTGVLHLLDQRGSHGVFVTVLIPLAEGEGHLTEVAQILPPPPRLATSHLDERGVYTGMLPEITAILGWQSADLVGQLALDRIHPEDHDVVIDAWMELLTRPEGTARTRIRHLHRDGRWVWLEVTNRNHLARPGAGHVESEMLDISDEMQALEALKASEQLLSQLAGALPVGVVQLDHAGELVYVNERLHQLLGSERTTPLHELQRCVVEGDVLAASIASVLSGEDVDVELHVDPADGARRRRCALALRVLSTPDGRVTGAVGCLTDITDDRRMRAELEQRVAMDPMTGCANRPAAMQTLEEELARTGKRVSVIFVDLDRFKAVNDLYGHAAGDDLLVAVAARLRSAVRDVDLVARIGGDEFLVVCPDVSALEGMLVAERVVGSLHVPFSLGERVLSASASVGMATSVDGERGEALIARADGAMYRSKREGGRRPVLAAVPPPDDGDLGRASAV